MKLLCVLFGHKSPCYALGMGADYSEVHGRGVDGIGRHHASVYGECPRCHEKYHITRIHIPRIIEEPDV